MFWLSASDGRENVLVVTDIFTKFTQAFATRDQRAQTVARILVKEWFLKFGVPSHLHGDQGRNFECEVVNELCKFHNIKKSRTTPYHTEGNSQTERLLRTLSTQKKKRWPDYLAELTYAYNATPHKSTGYSTFYLLFGREPKLPIDIIFGHNQEEGHISVGDWLESHELRMADSICRACTYLEKQALSRLKRVNKHRKELPIRIGTRVFLRNRVKGRNKIQDLWDPTPYKVIERPNQGQVYKVRPADGFGPTRTINRADILDSKELCPMYDVNKLPSAKNSKNEVPADGYELDVESDQDDEILLIDHAVEEVQNLSASDNDVEVPHQSYDSTPSSDEEVRDSPPVESQTVFEPRRSKRSTA